MNIEPRKHTIIIHFLHSELKIAHRTIALGGRVGRALDLLVMERAAELVVPSLAQPARRSAALVPMLGHDFCPPSGVGAFIPEAGARRRGDGRPTAGGSDGHGPFGSGRGDSTSRTIPRR